MMSNSVKLNDIYAAPCIKSNSVKIDEQNKQSHNVFFDDLTKELKEYRQSMEDCFTYKEDIRFQLLTDKKLKELLVRHDQQVKTATNSQRIKDDTRIIPKMNIIMRVRDINGDRWEIIPTMHAWQQIIKKLGMAKNFFNLLAEHNPHLLNENLNFLMDHMPSCRFLLRLVSLSQKSGNKTGSTNKKDKPRTFVLRAFLSKNFSRMDNVYMSDAIRNGLSNIPEKLDEISYSLDSNDMLIDISFKNKRKLTALQEEYVSGLRVRTSEIGRYKHILVMIMLKRLVCLNGMIVSADGGKIHIPYFSKKISRHRFPNLPPYPLDSDHQQSMDNEDKDKKLEIKTTMQEIESLIKEVIEQHKEKIDQFEENANRFINSFPSDRDIFLTDDDIEVAVSYVFDRIGIAAIGGAKSKDVIHYYREELNEWEEDKERNLGWVFLNAITRYASHKVIHDNLHLAQSIQSAVAEKLLNPGVITWNNIAEKVMTKRKEREEREKTIKPPDQPPI